MNKFTGNSGARKMDIRNFVKVVVGSFLLMLYTTAVHANDSYMIEGFEQLTLPGGAIQVRLQFDRPVEFEPKGFSIAKPARVSIDFPNTIVRQENKALQLDTGVINTIRMVQAKDRARLVVSLRALVPYEIRTESNTVYINFSKQVQAVNDDRAVQLTPAKVSQVDELDFRRGNAGEGKIKLKLSDASTIINIDEKGTKLVINIINAVLPGKLVRRLDVTDFATPITTIDAYNSDTGSKLVIDTFGSTEHMAYQAGNEFVIDVKPLSSEDVAERKKDQFGYSGDPLSLNFQNIEVRAVLQLMADFTGLNVVASDSVQGNITLRLKNVPWDQALDIILKTRGLGMRQTGNVVLIAPNDELADREKKELEAEKQKLELAPLRTAYFQINYAKASDIAVMLKAEKGSILTERGSVTIDERTNTLMVLETSEKHEEIASLIEKLDVPVRQVMIESRIVVANDDFGRDIGVRMGVSTFQDVTVVGSSPDIVTTSGSTDAAASLATNVHNIKIGEEDLLTWPADRYNVNLPGATAGRIGMAILGSSFLVDLELSALQTEGRGEVLSNPRVITSNQVEASIEQGVDIPYQEASSSGATSISFKKAALSLKVTPLITPDDKVSMKLRVTKDSVGGIYSGIPSINTRSIDTEVLVNNGDTVVLGGIYEQSLSTGETKIPLLGDIPILGVLFRSKSKKESKAELLIFVTPKILNDTINVDY